jgi:hypothetical protein
LWTTPEPAPDQPQPIPEQSPPVAIAPAPPAPAPNAATASVTAPAKPIPLEPPPVVNDEAEQLARDIAAIEDQERALIAASDNQALLCRPEPQTIAGLHDLEARKIALHQLRERQIDVVAFLATFDLRCRAAMTADHLPPSAQEQQIVAAKNLGRIEPLLSLWEVKAKRSSDYIRRLDFLRVNWGSWTIRNETVHFDNPELSDAYAAIDATLGNDMTQIATLRDQTLP